MKKYFIIGLLTLCGKSYSCESDEERAIIAQGYQSLSQVSVEDDFPFMYHQLSLLSNMNKSDEPGVERCERLEVFKSLSFSQKSDTSQSDLSSSESNVVKYTPLVASSGKKKYSLKDKNKILKEELKSLQKQLQALKDEKTELTLHLQELTVKKKFMDCVLASFINDENLKWKAQLGEKCASPKEAEAASGNPCYDTYQNLSESCLSDALLESDRFSHSACHKERLRRSSSLSSLVEVRNSSLSDGQNFCSLDELYQL